MGRLRLGKQSGGSGAPFSQAVIDTLIGPDTDLTDNGWAAQDSSTMTRHAGGAGASGTGRSVYKGNGPFTDCEAYITVEHDGDWHIVYARNDGSPSSVHSYGAQWGGGSFFVVKVTGSSGAVLGSTVSMDMTQAGQKIGVRCIGNVISAWADLLDGNGWVKKCEATDDDYASGYLGVSQGAGVGLISHFGGGAPAAAGGPAHFAMRGARLLA